MTVRNTDPAAVARKLREALDDEWAPLEGGPLRAPVLSSVINEAATTIDDLTAYLKTALEDARVGNERKESITLSLSHATMRAESAERSRDAALREVERLRGALESVGRKARSDGNRTFDDTIRDLGLIDDLCRAALSTDQASWGGNG